MKTITIRELGGELEQVANMVADRNEPVKITTSNGTEVRIIPIPKPIGFRRGVPIYRDEDLQYLYLDHPYWFEA